VPVPAPRIEHDPRRAFSFRAASGLSCPANGVGDILLGEVEFPNPGSHRVRPLDAHRRKDDLAAFDLHLEILGGADGIGHSLGQRELILGRRKHGISLDVQKNESLLWSNPSRDSRLKAPNGGDQ